MMKSSPPLALGYLTNGVHFHPLQAVDICLDSRAACLIHHPVADQQDIWNLIPHLPLQYMNAHTIIKKKSALWSEVMQIGYRCS